MLSQYSELTHRLLSLFLFLAISEPRQKMPFSCVLLVIKRPKIVAKKPENIYLCWAKNGLYQIFCVKGILKSYSVSVMTLLEKSEGKGEGEVCLPLKGIEVSKVA